jgi:hypothetical protein
MIRRNSLALVLLALVSVSVSVGAAADVLVEGTKRINRIVYVDNVADHPDLAFFTFVTHLNYAAPIFPAKPLDIGNGNPMNGIYVVGIPRDRLQAVGGKPQPGWFPKSFHRGRPYRFPLPAGVLISSTEVPHDRTTARIDPTEHLITHLAISLEPASAKAPAHLVLRVVGEERFDNAGKTISRKAGPVDDAQPSADSDPTTAWLWAGLPLIALGGITVLALRRRAIPQP